MVRFWGPKNRPCLWGKETQCFLGFVLRIVACVFVKEVYACIVGRQHESACYGSIFGPPVGRQRKKQKKCNLPWCAFGGRKIVPASGRRKCSVFWGFVWRAVHAKVTIFENCSHKRICLARRHFWTLPWTALTGVRGFLVRFWGAKKCPCLWEKETQRFLGLRFARRGC